MSCSIQETKGGVHLYGFIGDVRVQADLALVDDTIYVFTNVRIFCLLLLLLSPAVVSLH